jgi:MoxR-like ATPase
MFNVNIDYLPLDEEIAVVLSTTSHKPEAIQPLFTGEDVTSFHEVVRRVPVAEDVARYAVKLAAASRPGRPGTPEFINEWVNWGAGLRAGQTLVLGGKARALLHGRAHVTIEDIQALAHPTLRHRVLVGYKAEAEGVSVDDVIDRLLKQP